MSPTLEWKKLSTSKFGLKDAMRIVAAERRIVAVAVKGGATVELTDAGWRAVGETDDFRCHGLFVGWGGAIHRFANDGCMQRLDGDAWVEVSAPDEKFTGFFPLCAFDPVHGQLVVWGSAGKGRKDDTFVHDGKAWSKGKRPKAKHADVEASGGSFCLWFDPGAQRVVRAGVTEAAVFDGKEWRTVPLDGGAHLATWERGVGDLGGRALSWGRHIADRKVVELVRAGEGYSARVVGDFPAAVKRDPMDGGGNAAFDLGVIDGAHRRLIAIDAKRSETFAADLSVLG